MLDIYEEKMIKAGLATPEDFGATGSDVPQEERPVEQQEEQPEPVQQPEPDAVEEPQQQAVVDTPATEDEYISYDGDIIKANKIPQELRQKLKRDKQEKEELKATLQQLQQERDQYVQYYQQQQQQQQYAPQQQQQYNPSYADLDPSDPIDANKIELLQLKQQVQQFQSIYAQERQQQEQIQLTHRAIEEAREIDKKAEKSIPDYGTTVKNYETMRRNMLRHENPGAAQELVEQQINIERVQLATYALNSKEDVALFYYNYGKGKVNAAREALGIPTNQQGVNHDKIQENRQKHMVISGGGGVSGTARKDPAKMNMDDLREWVTSDQKGYESYLKSNPGFRKRKYDLLS